MTTVSYDLKRFNVSLSRGFLPDTWPVIRLSSSYYAPWESVLDKLPQLIADQRVRSVVDDMVTLSTVNLLSEEEWRRAYLILSFMTHAYIWTGTQPADTLPPSICRPYLVIAAHFDLPPTATYAALNLWNWRPKFQDADLTLPENVQMLHTFTRTTDEEWFYSISVAIEARGAGIIPTMVECFEAAQSGTPIKVARLLEEISRQIVQLGQILDRMHERCDPNVFYHRIRPFLAGSKGMTTAGLPNGVFYSTGDKAGSWRQYSGGSNAQSSLIQMLDLMLGVEHYATDNTMSTSQKAATRAKQGYIQEMRAYMPQQHRLFLKFIEKNANIRAYAMKPGANHAVQQAYVKALDSLTVFRDKHMQLVARYIIAPSRKPSPSRSVNIATASSSSSSQSSQSSDNKPSKQPELCGTGGTHLMPFLKQTRDETKQAGTIPSIDHHSHCEGKKTSHGLWKIVVQTQGDLPVFDASTESVSILRDGLVSHA